MAEARCNESEVEWEPDRSPKGVFESYYRLMSASLQAEARAPHGLARQRPFEVDLVRLAPGRRLCPRHSHSMQWEYYIVLSGHGRMLQEDGREPLPMEPGDHIVQPPGWVHTTENIGDEDLVYYVIADNPTDETCFYPDSGKWATANRVFRMQEADYFDGEE